MSRHVYDFSHHNSMMQNLDFKHNCSFDFVFMIITRKYIWNVSYNSWNEVVCSCSNDNARYWGKYILYESGVLRVVNLFIVVCYHAFTQPNVEFIR